MLLKKPSNLTERIAWALQAIKSDREVGKGINDVDLGKKLGINKDTVGSYRKGKGSYKSSVIEGLIEHYCFNAEWLLSGRGEPYKGANNKLARPDGKRDHLVLLDADSSSGQKLPNTSPEGEDEMRGTKWSDDIAMAARILESRTPYATALRLNIQAFGRAMSAEQRISQVEQRVTSSESQLLQKLDDLTSRLQELETRNAELESHTPPPPDKPTPPDEEKE